MKNSKTLGLPPASSSFLGVKPLEQIEINTDAIEKMKDTLFKEKEGLVAKVETHDNVIISFKSFKIVLGFAITVTTIFLGFILYKLFELIQKVTEVSTMLSAHIGGI